MLIMTLSLWEEQSTCREKRMVGFFQKDESQGWSFLLKSVSSATTAEVLSQCSLLTSTYKTEYMNYLQMKTCSVHLICEMYIHSS